MRLAIHQPNFFPWMPYFEKIMAVDVFVVMINCQYEKGKYQNRFNFLGRWHTLGVVSRNVHETIVSKQYANSAKDWEVIKARLSDYPVLAEFDDCISDSLCCTNMAIINRLLKILLISVPVMMDKPTTLRSSARLVDICQQNNASTYVSGVSGKKYLDLEVFKDAGISVEFQDLENSDKRHVLEVISHRSA